MKKILVALCLFALGNLATAVAHPIYVQVQIFDNTPHYPGKAKTPAPPQILDLTGHTLTFPYAYNEAVPVELLGEDGEAVYTDCLYPGETALMLPESLSGSYTLHLTVGNYYYIGNVEL